MKKDTVDMAADMAAVTQPQLHILWKSLKKKLLQAVVAGNQAVAVAGNQAAAVAGNRAVAVAGIKLIPFHLTLFSPNQIVQTNDS